MFAKPESLFLNKESSIPQNLFLMTTQPLAIAAKMIFMGRQINLNRWALKIISYNAKVMRYFCSSVCIITVEYPVITAPKPLNFTTALQFHRNITVTHRPLLYTSYRNNVTKEFILFIFIGVTEAISYTLYSPLGVTVYPYLTVSLTALSPAPPHPPARP